MTKVAPWPLLLLFAILFSTEFLISSCASRSAPGGGPRDTTAPALDTSFPANFSTHFESKSIELIFDEYISLKNPSQQISFSPPLNRKPEILPLKKEIRISWTDTLLPKTTYTISFGSAITDFTEGNVNDDFKYVFSTGDFIDSLELRGQVVDSKTGEGEEELLVALYDLSRVAQPDSIAYLNLPTYYTYTDENGLFSLSNLKYGNFHVVAFEDKRGNFKLNTGTEKIAFLSDTLQLTDTTEPVKLYSFTPSGEPRFLGAKHVARNQIQVSFNYSVPDLEVTALHEHEDSLRSLVTFSKHHDTANYWFDQGERDSLVLQLAKNGAVFDTARLFLRPFDESEFLLSVPDPEINFNTSIRLKSGLPVRTISESEILVFSPEDTLAISDIEQTGPMEINIALEKKRPAFTLYLKEGAVESFTGKTNDSLSFELKTLKREDLGNLDFAVETDSTLPLVLVVHNPKRKEIIRETFQGKTEISLKHRKPGIYPIELIIDRDRDGRWSPGNYLTREQPERIVPYADQAEVRGNWDLELIWKAELREKTLSQSNNLNSSRSDKN